MVFCFVILHYKTADDTIECIESIKAKQRSFKIVIVDNYSDNGSIEIIEEKYRYDDDIFIIKNSENLGFSSGNNIGYQFAREKLKADFIAISNNDIILDTANIEELSVAYFESHRFDVMGPNIESLVDHKHQNPMVETLKSIEQVKKEILRYRLLYLLSKLGLYDILKKSRDVKNNNSDTSFEDYCEDIQLHGSFVIFSPSFIKNEEYSFRPGTFLYMEEAILYKYCKGKGYKCVYNPDIKVYHKEDSSTNSLYKANKEKREFVFKNMINSLKVYKEVLTQNNKGTL